MPSEVRGSELNMCRVAWPPLLVPIRFEACCPLCKYPSQLLKPYAAAKAKSVKVLNMVLRCLSSPCATGAAVAFIMVVHWVCNFSIGQLFLPAVAKFGVRKTLCASRFCFAVWNCLDPMLK